MSVKSGKSLINAGNSFFIVIFLAYVLLLIFKKMYLGRLK